MGLQCVLLAFPSRPGCTQLLCKSVLRSDAARTADFSLMLSIVIEF